MSGAIVPTSLVRPQSRSNADHPPRQLRRMKKHWPAKDEANSPGDACGDHYRAHPFEVVPLKQAEDLKDDDDDDNDSDDVEDISVHGDS
jgi:hypothetical protein